MPLLSDAGVEAEVDWGQAQVILRGEPVEVHIFLMRACHSGASFVAAFQAESQQAFLQAHVAAFEWFGGVFALLRYDNLKSAVARVLKGRRRAESDRFVALRSRYLFESSFCQRGERGAHEKGGVEGEVGRFRRRHLVPVPKIQSIAELNELLLAACQSDLQRTIVGRAQSVGEMLARERLLFGELPREAHCTAEEATPRVDAKAMVTVEVLLLLRELPAAQVELAVRGALTAGSHDGRAVALLARRCERAASPALEVQERLAGIDIAVEADVEWNLSAPSAFDVELFKGLA